MKEWIISDKTTPGSISVLTSENAECDSGMLSAVLDQAYKVEIFQTIEGLCSGYYYLTALAQKGAGEMGSRDQNVCYLYGRGSSQPRIMTAIPRLGVENSAVCGTYRRQKRIPVHQ